MYTIEKSTINKRKDPISPWVTKGLLKSINKKNKLYKQYLRHPSQVNLNKFKTFKNKLTMLLRKSKRKYFFPKIRSIQKQHERNLEEY